MASWDFAHFDPRNFRHVTDSTIDAMASSTSNVSKLYQDARLWGALEGSMQGVQGKP